MFDNKTDKEIHNLIFSIQKAITEFSEGDISLNEGEEEYERLLDIYNKIEDIKKNNKGPDIISGLCYYNNIENYSLLSGVYYSDSRETIPVSYYGDNNLNSKTVSAINKHKNEIRKNQIIMVPPGENMLHPIYIYPLIMENSDLIVFATISSSNYFAKEKYYFSARLLKALFSVTRDAFHHLRWNYFDEVSKEIEKILKDNIDDEHYIEATLYVFNLVETIFSHLGIKTMVHISETFSGIMKKTYRENSRFFTLSLRDYLVLVKKRKGDEEPSKKKKIDFIYNKLHIPYKTLEIKVESVDSIHNFWEKILLFENYLETGDVMK